jgi:hypothetical protein
LSVLPVGFGSALGGYQIERSLRFNSADSAYLNRTPGSAGNRRTWTWSGWVKKAKVSSVMGFLSAGTNGNQIFFAGFGATDDKIYIHNGVQGTSTASWAVTSAVYRDPSAWYHIVLAVDTTQATDTNRIKLYVNNQLQTLSAHAGASTYPTQNYDTAFNNNVIQELCYGYDNSSKSYFDGYLTEVNFIDGQALTPSSFGETDSNTGVWKPKAYTGTYGTNGFFLKFADNSNTTAATLGKDSSGNGNNWTPNNFSVTAGAGNDSLVDTPTAYGTDTGVGGTVRGNYCTWNPLSTGRTLSNGNLDYAGSATGVAKGTLGVSSGKWYWEILANGANASAGVASVSLNPTTSYCGATADSWCLFTSGDRYNNGSATSGYSTFTTNDIISIALDMDNGKVYWAKNGVWQGSSNPVTGTNAGYTNLSGYTITPANGNNNTNDLGTANFGQRAFAYTAPSGFKALCTQNLPTPTIGATSTTQANDYFNAVLYTGTGSSQGITGVGFQPDWVWIKERSGAADHGLYDAVRGVQKQIESNRGDNTESTQTTGLTAFNSDGFTVGSLAQLNTNTDTYVAWNWKANGAGGSNTAGTISSTVSANTTSGFSIVTYTGNGSSGATIGHGLGVTPSMIMIRVRNSDQFSWGVYHASVGNTAGLYLNLTNAAATTSVFWNNTSPTSSVFSVGNWGGVNGNTSTYVAYCFAPVAGYSAFGSYVGNGSTDGPFVYTGFRPRYVLIKASSEAGSWILGDTARSPYNIQGARLFPNATNAEDNNFLFDYLSNGFKVRNSASGNNTNGQTYTYAAFAETPAKFSLAF